MTMVAQELLLSAGTIHLWSTKNYEHYGDDYRITEQKENVFIEEYILTNVVLYSV